jgi:hypothetical protein
MFTQDEQGVFDQETEYAPDTSIPKDLAEHLEKRKEDRKDIIKTTSNLTGYLVTWSMNATGFFLAKGLILFGGSINFWLAISLCFTFCAIVPLAGLNDFRINYKGSEGGVEVDNGQSTIKVAFGLGSAGLTTWLAVKDFKYYQDMTSETIEAISNDVISFESQHTKADSFSGIVTIGLLVVSAIALFAMVFRTNKN